MDLQELIAAMEVTAAAKPRPVDVPGWGLVYVRELTVADVEAQQSVAASGDKTAFARGAARLLCDEHGKLLLDPENEQHIALLAKQPWSLLRNVVGETEPEQKKTKPAARVPNRPVV